MKLKLGIYLDYLSTLTLTLNINKLYEYTKN